MSTKDLAAQAYLGYRQTLNLRVGCQDKYELARANDVIARARSDFEAALKRYFGHEVTLVERNDFVAPLCTAQA